MNKTNFIYTVFIVVILMVTSCMKYTPYFEYDEVIHYNNPFDAALIGEVKDKRIKSYIDSLEVALLFDAAPRDMSNLHFIKELDQAGYTSQRIPKSKFDELNTIFCDKPVKERYVNSCIYVYRDLFVFKKEGEIVGFSKVCFGCDAHWTIGTNEDTSGFGMDGDYEKLYKLINRKSE